METEHVDEAAAVADDEAARHAASAAAWDRIIGDRYDTSHVRRMLGAIRQALSNRQRISRSEAMERFPCTPDRLPLSEVVFDESWGNSTY